MSKYLLVFLNLLALVGAHNWLNSPSRVPNAATVFPCMNSRTIYPHVQVGRGQLFQTEWSTGHDRNVYFVLIQKNNSAYLANDSPSDLDKYILAAPQQLMSAEQRKYHRSGRAFNSTHVLGGPLSNYYSEQIMPTDTRFVARPSAFGSSKNQYAYGSSPNDAYVSYFDAKRPWILAVWRYEIQAADPGEADFALFRIPNNQAGDYILHYLWSGYYDCVDINVLDQSTPTLYPYGKPVNGSGALKANRVDHCVFDRPLKYTTFPRLVLGSNLEEAAKNCIDRCMASWEAAGCGGVSVFSLSLILTRTWVSGADVLKNFYEQAWNASGHFKDMMFDRDYGVPADILSNINSTANVWSGLWRFYRIDARGQEQYVGINQTTLNALRTFVEAQPDAHICILTQPRFPSTTEDKFTLADDPDDPIWSSTCYEIIQQLEFIGYNTTLNEFQPNIATRYTVGRCISCEDAASFADPKYTPDWQVAPKCTLCERDNPAPVVNRPFVAPLQTRSSLSINIPGINGTNSSCTLPSGFTDWTAYCIPSFRGWHPYVTAERAQNGWFSTSTTSYAAADDFRASPAVCGEWVKRQSSICSNIMSWQPDSYGSGCRCVRNTPCCLKYYRTADTTSKQQLFEVTPTTPDPFCNSSVALPSVNRTHCCRVPSTNRNACGTNMATACATVSGGATADGAYCRGYLIPPTRKCSKFAPPCML